MSARNPAAGSGIGRPALRLAAVALGIAALWLSVCGLRWCVEALPSGAGPDAETMLAAVLVAYALLLAMPFVPAAEIGLALIAVAGAKAAPLVWLATLCGLALAFALGRWLPPDRLAGGLRWLGLARLAARLERQAAPLPAARLARLRDRLPGPLARLPLGSRYVLLALLINLPGSAVIGGGGGICMAAGLSRLFHPALTLAVIALAVSPVPLAVWLWWPGLLSH